MVISCCHGVKKDKRILATNLPPVENEAATIKQMEKKKNMLNILLAPFFKVMFVQPSRKPL